MGFTCPNMFHDFQRLSSLKVQCGVSENLIKKVLTGNSLFFNVVLAISISRMKYVQRPSVLHGFHGCKGRCASIYIR